MSLEPTTDSELDRLREALGEQYVIYELLGAGGMGNVYRARDRKLDRAVAIKVVPSDLRTNEATHRRFLAETRMLAGLRHPNIVTLYTAGDASGLLYYVMDLVPGESLRDRLTRERQCDPATARRVLREIADALAYAHAHGVVHRDIKPENVLLDAELGRAMLTDFGIARALAGEERLTRAGVAIGSPRYMSPEQAMGQDGIDGRSDLYSLGVVGYEMLAGEAPFSGDAQSVMARQITTRPPALRDRVPDAPPPLLHAIERALEKDPADRWPSAADMSEALGTGARPAVTATRRRPRVALIAAAAVVVAVVGGWFALRPGSASGGADQRKSFFIAPFEVQGGDPSLAWLREGSMNMLGLNLSAWSDLRVVPYEHAMDLLRDARVDDGARIGLALARNLARNAGVGTVVTGQIIPAGDSLSVVARIYAVSTGDLLREETVSAAAGTDPRAIFDQLARKLLDLAGAPPMTPELARLTTTSLTAYRAYISGLRFLNRMDTRAADTAFAEAIAADSTFALAYYKRALSRSWGPRPGDEPRASDTTSPRMMRLASQYGGRLPYREQALIAGYHAFTSAMQANRGGRARESGPLFAEAIGHFKRVIDRDSTDAEGWFLLADAYVHDVPLGGPANPRRLRGQAVRWTAALRALGRAIRFDSSFHLSYQHRHDIYVSAAGDNSPLLLLGDSVIYLGDTAGVGLTVERVGAARATTRASAINDARQWTFIEPDAVNSHHSLVGAFVAAGQYDSALTALREAMRRPNVVRPYMHFWLAGILMAAGDTTALTALRAASAAYPVDSLYRQRLVRNAGVGAAANGVVAAYNVALYHGLFREMERFRAYMDTLRVFGANVPRFARGAPLVDKAGWGVDDPDVRRQVQEFIDAVDEFRASAATGSAPEVGRGRLALAFVGLRDTAYFAALRRWQTGVVDPELEALAALDAGDTARAARLVRSSTLAEARRGIGPQRVADVLRFARAEVYAATGDPRRALAELDRIDPKRFVVDASPEPRWALYPRTFLLRGAILERLGDRGKALQAYRAFLSMWRSADPVLDPQIKLAREAVRRLGDAPR